MAILIGTAGHVDHGKTTLLEALTGTNADRLPEEKARGLTIDIGFASMTLPNLGEISWVDVPGHEKFLTNMLAGATAMDVAMLCVAADQGVMPQTREHFAILELLPVQQIVVALTRSDLADEITLAITHEQLDELLGSTRFKDSPRIEVSAKVGTGLADLKTALAVAIESCTPRNESRWYLPVDRIFTVAGRGTVVTGTLLGRKLSAGSAALVLPEGLETRIKALQVHFRTVESGEPGQRVALNLNRISPSQLVRGSVIAEPGAAFATTVFDLEVRWIATPKHGSKVRVALGADDVIGKLFLSDHDESLAQIRTDRPTVAALHQAAIIRVASSGKVLGGGAVTTPIATVRRKNAALVRPEDQSLVGVVAANPEGVPTAEIARQLGQSPQQLGDEIEKLRLSGELIGFAGLWFTQSTWELASERLLQGIRACHDETPAKALIPRESAVKRAGLSWSGKPLDRMISHMSAARVIRSNGTMIAAIDHRPTLPAKQRQLLDRVLATLSEADLLVPNPHELGLQLRIPPQAVTEIIRVGHDTGELVTLAEGVIYPVETLDRAIERLREKFAGTRFTAADFKAFFGTTRKYTIPLMEQFDAWGITLRQGDTRVVK